MTQFSFFLAPITNTRPDSNVSISSILKLIKSKKYQPAIEKIRACTDKKKRDKLKLQLDYFTPAGVFSARAKDKLIEPTGYAIIDIDDLDAIADLKQKLQDDAFVHLLFVSPSGNGLKIIIKVPKDKSSYEQHVFGFYQYLANKYALDFDSLDSATRDISRACFVSYDRQAYYNPESIEFTEKKEPESISQSDRQVKDESRSAEEYRKIISLLLKGKSKEQIFKRMQAYKKWSDSSEAYREHTYQKAKKYFDSSKELPSETSHIDIKADVLELLKDPNLLNIIDAEFDKKIVGEHQTRQSVFLISCGKYVKNHQVASYNLCANSSSGAGKDYIFKAILGIYPREDVVIRSRISPTAFTYWHNANFEPLWSWDCKICLLSDISNNILNHEVFKIMCSDATYSTVVIKQAAIDIQINGKPVLFITTASAEPNNEMLRRMPMLQLDESINQTKAIKKSQARAAVYGVVCDYDSRITDALRALRTVKVKIPFAEKLTDAFPDDHIIMRTHFQRLLDYIKASAALFQYQRETDSEGYILAQPEDYDNAIIPLQKTTTNILMIPLTKKQQKLLDVCRELKTFTVKNIEPKIPFISHARLYDYLSDLQDMGFLSSHSGETEYSDKPVRHYSYLHLNSVTIPSYSEICRILEFSEQKEFRELVEFREFASLSSENNEKTSLFTKKANSTCSANSMSNRIYNGQNIAPSDCGISRQPVEISVIYEKLHFLGVDKENAAGVIQKWKADGLIYEPLSGYIAMVK